MCDSRSVIGTMVMVILQTRKTLQATEARIISRFGWGLTKTIENHGLTRFKANVQRVGVASLSSWLFVDVLSILSREKAFPLFLDCYDSLDCNPWQ